MAHWAWPLAARPASSSSGHTPTPTPTPPPTASSLQGPRATHSLVLLPSSACTRPSWGQIPGLPSPLQQKRLLPIITDSMKQALGTCQGYIPTPPCGSSVCLSPRANGITWTCPTGLGRSDDCPRVKHLQQCPAHSKCSINMGNYRCGYCFPF